ncbi:MAG: hypothetical protein AAF089_07075 [Bacteroidota bacterium]
MSQTIGAIIALMAASVLAMNVQQGAVRSKMDMVAEETETYAGSVALDVLDYISTTAFDEATKGGGSYSRDELTAVPFSTGKRYEDADDIDDFHEIQTYTFTSGYESYEFEVDVTVQYVSEEDGETVSGTPTFAKLVTVYVTNPILQRYDRTVTMSQVMTYGS